MSRRQKYGNPSRLEDSARFVGRLTPQVPLDPQVLIDPHLFSRKYIKKTLLTPSGFTTYRLLLEDIGKDIGGGQNDPFGVYVDQKSLVFPGLCPWGVPMLNQFAEKP